MVESFGQALRRLRESAGLSQPQLARRVPISQASLSRYERGLQAVDPKIADRLDTILNAAGTLRALLPPEPTAILTPDDQDRIAYGIAHPSRIDRAALDSLAAVLAASRRLEDTVGAWAVLEPAGGYARLLERLVHDVRGQIRPSVVDIAAQWAQFAGWLHMSVDRVAAAAGWFDRAFEWAAEADNVTLQANSLTFKGNLAWLAGHIGRMIGLAQAAQRNIGVFVGQRGFAATLEARGYAYIGEVDACERKLAEAGILAEQLAEQTADAPPWNYDTPALLTLERGLVYRHLGRLNQSAELLEAGLSALPADLRTAEWAMTYRADLEAVRAAL